MRPIPKEDKNILKEKKQVCVKCGTTPVEWHHPLIYSGRQIIDWWATTFACKKCHDKATPHKNEYDQEVREFFEHIILQEHLGDLLVKYPKGTWFQHLRYLNKKYDSSVQVKSKDS